MHVASPTEQIKTLHLTHSGATTVMVPVVINASVLVPLNTRLANEQNAYFVEGLLANVVKATGEAWAINATLYWDAGNARFTTTSAGNTKCGKAASVQAAGDTTGVVAFSSGFTP